MPTRRRTACFMMFIRRRDNRRPLPTPSSSACVFFRGIPNCSACPRSGEVERLTSPAACLRVSRAIRPRSVAQHVATPLKGFLLGSLACEIDLASVSTQGSDSPWSARFLCRQNTKGGSSYRCPAATASRGGVSVRWARSYTQPSWLV
jgi:hypothetical protein